MVLLGIVPVLKHTPPTMVCFSTTATAFPIFAAWMAARCPPGPEPITTRSNGRIRGILDFFGGYLGLCRDDNFRASSISGRGRYGLRLTRTVNVGVRLRHQ